MNIHGFNETELMAIIGNMALANNRLSILLQAKDQEIEVLKQTLAEKESNERLGITNTK